MNPLRWRVDEQIDLRLFEDGDAETLFRLVDANRVHLRAWLPWVDGVTSVNDQLGFIHQAREQFERDDGFQVGIWEIGTLVGCAGYHSIDRTNRATEIGYWLAATAQGRGIMTRVCRYLVGYAFADLGLNRVVIRCASGNERSAAIPKRLGFTHELIDERQREIRSPRLPEDRHHIAIERRFDTRGKLGGRTWERRGAFFSRLGRMPANTREQFRLCRQFDQVIVRARRKRSCPGVRVVVP